MASWNYGNAFERFPTNDGKVWHSKDNSIKLAVHDLRNGIHPLHIGADCIFVDPPWNLGNLNTFITKADLKSYEDNFDDFLFKLFEIVDTIKPTVMYIEIGKQSLEKIQNIMKARFLHVKTFNSYYYHNKKNVCYIVRGSLRKTEFEIPEIEGIDEECAIKEICKSEKFDTILDCCMGRGLVALYAAKFKRNARGTELNHKRLSVAVERLIKAGVEMCNEQRRI